MRSKPWATSRLIRTAGSRRLRSATIPCSAALPKVLASLVRAGLIRSKRGLSGGYRLARRPAQISLREVVQILERPVAPLSCVSVIAPVACVHQSSCVARRDLYVELRDATHAVLGRFSAADLARDFRMGRGYSTCLAHLWHPQQDLAVGRQARV